MIVPDGGDHETDRDQIMFGEVAILYEPVPQGEVGAAMPVAGVDGYRVTLVHDENGVMVDAPALGGDDPLLIVGAGSGMLVEPVLRDRIPEVVGSVRRQ